MGTYVYRVTSKKIETPVGIANVAKKMGVLLFNLTV